MTVNILDIIIILVMMIIAITMIMGKPFKIEIKHTYPTPPKEEWAPVPTIDDKEEAEASIKDVIDTINSIMNGGDSVGR